MAKEQPTLELEKFCDLTSLTKLIEPVSLNEVMQRQFIEEDHTRDHGWSPLGNWQ